MTNKTNNKKENKRIDVEEELLKQETKNIKKQLKERKKQERLDNPGKLRRTASFAYNSTKGIFSHKSKENKRKQEEQAPKGILAEQADELAAAMKKARSKNELFQLARLMRNQSKEIQEIARRI